MPAPIMAPMPGVIRFQGPSARFSWCSPAESASARSVAMDLVAHKLMRDSVQEGDESTARTAPTSAPTGDLSIEEGRQYESLTRTVQERCSGPVATAPTILQLPASRPY